MSQFSFLFFVFIWTSWLNCEETLGRIGYDVFLARNPNGESLRSDSWVLSGNFPFSWEAEMTNLNDIPSQYLHIYNFSMSIPLDATIQGIEVRVEKKGEVGDPNSNWALKDNGARLMSDMTFFGGNKNNAANWFLDWETTVYGGPNDVWGTNWAIGTINDYYFGFGLSAFNDIMFGQTPNAFVRSVTMKIYYILPGSSSTTDIMVATSTSNTMSTTDMTDITPTPQGTSGSASSPPPTSETSSSTSSPTSKSSSPSTNVAAIVVPIVVILVAIGIAGLVIFLVWDKKRKRNESELDLELNNENVMLSNINIHERLGGGSFGDVFRGSWQGTDVALKKLKSESAAKEFEHEAKTLKALRHPFVVQFLGIYEDPNTSDKFIVTEFMTGGSLQNILYAQKDKISLEILAKMAYQAGNGVQYLHSNFILHRDIALRNLLVTGEAQYTVKLGDFGLAKRFEGRGFKDEEVAIAYKWAAPEVLQERFFSPKSDIWAFGITLWEIFSGGKVPFASMTNAEVEEKIKQGYRLDKPEYATEEVFELIRACWNENAEDRLQIKQIVSKLKEIAKDN